ncbi:right-handed parallel beta-helix repeat-containing protein, partial [bacterium]|nr:right-handed parallel beta-helix repeat-containing protein [bacterium]
MNLRGFFELENSYIIKTLFLGFLCMLAFLVSPLSSAQADVVYVDGDIGSSGDGTSWGDAYTDLQDALASASAGDDIWVAEGTYKPTSVTDRTATFLLTQDINLYGGFDGTETSLNQRNWTIHPTILSGDIGIEGVSSDNSYHVVKIHLVPSDSFIIDGFTITGGNANGSSDKFGGGFFNVVFSSLAITNCIISGNNADIKGGGIYNESNSPTITNCIISGNKANDLDTSYGGGISNKFSSPTIINCTISSNSAVSNGGGIYNESSSSPTITNCILWENTAANGPEIYNLGAGDLPSIRYSDIEGCGGSISWDTSLGTDGGGNIDSDPLFLGTGDYNVTAFSPCIDSGFGDNGVSVPITDKDGNPRYDDLSVDNTGSGNPNFVDIGAYERQIDSYAGPCTAA